jgi:hypothetical protein
VGTGGQLAARPHFTRKILLVKLRRYRPALVGRRHFRDWPRRQFFAPAGPETRAQMWPLSRPTRRLRRAAETTLSVERHLRGRARFPSADRPDPEAAELS